jgi:putative heme degradation protein
MDTTIFIGAIGIILLLLSWVCYLLSRLNDRIEHLEAAYLHDLQEKVINKEWEVRHGTIDSRP